MEQRRALGVLALAVFVSGCVEMRDYTGVREGAFGLDVRTRFGEGTDKKDYYATGNGQGIVRGDTKEHVVSLIGSPDEIDMSLEGYESWLYEEYKLRVLFDGERVKEWHEADSGSAS